MCSGCKQQMFTAESGIFVLTSWRMEELLPDMANCWSFKDEGILAAAMFSVGTDRGRVQREKARVVVERVREYICRETKGYWAAGSLFWDVFQVGDRGSVRGGREEAQGEGEATSGLDGRSRGCCGGNCGVIYILGPALARSCSVSSFLSFTLKK